MPQIIETFDEFCGRHGANLVKVGNGLWLLPDGAAVSNQGFGPRLHEPPDDLKARLETRKRYHAAKLKRIERDFHRLKNALKGEAAAFHWDTREYGPPRADGKAALLLLKELVAQHRKALTDLDNALAEFPDERERRRRAESLREAESLATYRAAELRAEVDAIHL